MVQFIQTIISGLSLGSVYALIALGYTMVYGIAKMLPGIKTAVPYLKGKLLIEERYDLLPHLLAGNLFPAVKLITDYLEQIDLRMLYQYLFSVFHGI